jgi:hypothetical protein
VGAPVGQGCLVDDDEQSDEELDRCADGKGMRFVAIQSPLTSAFQDWHTSSAWLSARRWAEGSAP